MIEGHVRIDDHPGAPGFGDDDGVADVLAADAAALPRSSAVLSDAGAGAARLPAAAPISTVLSSGAAVQVPDGGADTILQSQRQEGRLAERNETGREREEGCT